MLEGYFSCYKRVNVEELEHTENYLKMEKESHVVTGQDAEKTPKSLDHRQL